MPEPVAFRKLRVVAFRGFKDPVEFDLAASAVLVCGANGTGKTSFFDAMLWLLTGNIERLRELRAHEKDEWIVNEFARPGQAEVEAELIVGTQTIALRRSGDRRQSLLELRSQGQTLRGAQADRRLIDLLLPHGGMELGAMLLTSALLQQDVMRWLIEAKASERYRLLNQLLGLDMLDGFEAAAREFAKRANEEAQQARREQESLGAQRKALESRIAELEARQQLRPSVDEVLAGFEAAVGRHQDLIELAVDVRKKPREANRLFSDLRRLRRRIAELADTYRALQADRAGSSPVSEAEIQEATRAFSSAQEAVAAGRQELKQAADALAYAEQRSRNLARLASLAVPLLTEVCPVCELKIDPADVAHRLQVRAAETSGLLALREAHERAEGRVMEANQTLSQAEEADRQLKTRRAALHQVEQREATWRGQVRALASSSDMVRIDVPDRVDGVEQLLSPRYVEALADLEESAERLALVLGSSSEEQELQEMRGQVAQLAEQEDARERHVESLARREANAETLYKSAQKACMRVGERRAKALAPLVADIFSRLDPHPAFKTLDLEHEMYRAQAATVPMATDPLEGKSVNPALVFSTSQANIAALSIFLALSFAAGESALPFVLLDDPLQSLDDVNVLAFADLCRFIREERQLVLSTHDRRFAGLLERKLAPRHPDQATRVIRFTGWERTGPTVTSYLVEQQLNVPRLISA